MKIVNDRRTFVGGVYLSVYMSGILLAIVNRPLSTAQTTDPGSGEEDLYSTVETINVNFSTYTGSGDDDLYSTVVTSNVTFSTYTKDATVAIFTIATDQMELDSSSTLAETTEPQHMTDDTVTPLTSIDIMLESTEEMRISTGTETLASSGIKTSEEMVTSSTLTSFWLSTAGADLSENMRPSTETETLASSSVKTSDDMVTSSAPTSFWFLSSTTTPHTSIYTTTALPITTFPTSLATTRLPSSTFVIQTTTEKNPCLPNPCRNRGNCTKINSNTYSCSCAPGYTAHSCEIEINECESFPCLDFGKCIDLVNDYSCSCNSGYERVSNDSHTCKEIDYCQQSPVRCSNGSTCVNQPQLARYYCECPPTGIPHTYYSDLYCEHITTTFPVPDKISPNTGILAGGARLTVTGKGMTSIVPFGAYFVSHEYSNLGVLHGFVDANSSSDTFIVVNSPRALQEHVNRTLDVILEYYGPVNVTDGALRFTYQGDPVISDIQPRELLAAGGVELTVSGSNMNVVESPSMDITTIVENRTDNKITQLKYNENCESHQETKMTCRIPVGVVPAAFLTNSTAQTKSGLSLNTFFHVSSNSPHNRRRKKREPIASLIDPVTSSTFQMYLGFVFDNLPTYENTSKSIPSITFTLVTSFPVINRGATENFDPEKETFAYIAGLNLTKGCSMGDYTITLGNQNGTITNLTDNVITYIPPLEDILSSPDCDNKEAFTVTVRVSSKSQIAYCLRYTSGGPENLALIIGLSVAGGVILIIIICLSVIIVRKRRKKKKVKKLEEEEDSEESSASSKHDYDNHQVGFRPKSPDADYLVVGDEQDLASINPNDTAADLEQDASLYTPDVHRQGQSYYNEVVAENEQQISAEDLTSEKKWEYEPDDEALTFDLKNINFDEIKIRFPRLTFNAKDADEIVSNIA